MEGQREGITDWQKGRRRHRLKERRQQTEGGSKSDWFTHTKKEEKQKGGLQRKRKEGKRKDGKKEVSVFKEEAYNKC